MREFSRIIQGRSIKFPTQKQLRLLGEVVQCSVFTFILRTTYRRMNGTVLMDTGKTTKIDRNASGRKLEFNDREVIQTKQNVKRSTRGLSVPCTRSHVKARNTGTRHRRQNIYHKKKN